MRKGSQPVASVVGYQMAVGWCALLPVVSAASVIRPSFYTRARATLGSA